MKLSLKVFLLVKAYDKSEKFRKWDDTTILDYIGEIEWLNNKTWYGFDIDMDLPIGKLAYIRYSKMQLYQQRNYS